MSEKGNYLSVAWIVFLSIVLIATSFFFEKFYPDHFFFSDLAATKDVLQRGSTTLSNYAAHFSPLLYVTYLFPTPNRLLICKSIVIFVSIIILYRTIEKPAVFLFATTIPSFVVTALNITDHFYEVYLGIPFVLLAFYLFYIDKVLWGLVAFSISFLAKEEYPLLGIGIGLWLAIEKKNLKYTLYSVASLFAFIMTTKVMMPFLAYLSGETPRLIMDRYIHLGETLGEMIETILTRPFFTLFYRHNLQKALLFAGSLYVLVAFKKQIWKVLIALSVPIFYSWISVNYYYANILYLHFAVPVYVIILGLLIYYQKDVSTIGRIPINNKALIASNLVIAFLLTLYSMRPGQSNRIYAPNNLQSQKDPSVKL